MAGKPAARTSDSTAHLMSPLLPGPGSLNVMIGYLPAWRGIPQASAGALQTAKKASQVRLKAAKMATKAAMGTPAAPAAKAAEEALKLAEATAMGAMIKSMAGGADIHVCPMPLPIPPHGPGVVIKASKTVMINHLPACRVGDTLLEALGPTNKIVKGCFSVLIG